VSACGHDPGRCAPPARIGFTASNDSEVELYLHEISKFALLTIDEERQLAYRIAKGDAEARDHMIRSNLRLVVSIAKNYTERGMAFLDLIEEGNLGLLKAVGRFSPDQGCKFSTYASWWIKQTIRRALINKVKSVRVPAYMVEVLTRWKRASAQLAQKLGRDPDPEEIGRHLKLSPSKIAIIRQALSASAPVGRGGDSDDSFDLEDVLAGVPSREEKENTLPGEYDREALCSALEFALTERERNIVEMRYGLSISDPNDGGEPCTLEKIGERIGLTRERVRQIENQALRKLQMFLQQKDEREERERQERRRARDEAERQGLPRPQPKKSAPPQKAEKPVRARPRRRATKTSLPGDVHVVPMVPVDGTAGDTPPNGADAAGNNSESENKTSEAGS
jgi:RNA polymerase primary sigma factor